MKCKVCSSECIPFSKALVLDKYDVQYFSCGNCGFIQTEEPYWLNEAYGDVIARSDLGLIHRNIRFSTICASFIPIYFPKGRYLDFGGGNGMFVRMMRDRGFNFYWRDKLADNQFAAGFEAVDEIEYSLLTALELFEHLVKPLEEIEKMFSYSKNIFFSTRLIPQWHVEPSQWWYYALETGQHVSFYSRESLEVIARKFNVNLSSNGRSLHLLSKKRFPKAFLISLSFHPVSSLISTLLGIGRSSLLPDDYFNLTGKKLS